MVVDTELQDWGEGWSWKSNSSASGWRNGTAELVMLAAGKALGRIYWPAGGGGGRAALAISESLESRSWRFHWGGCALMDLLLGHWQVDCRLFILDKNAFSDLFLLQRCLTAEGRQDGPGDSVLF